MKHKLPPVMDRGVSQRLLMVVLGFGVFALWAGLVPLDEGISVAGTIVVDDDRKVVQHLEGGIIAELNVREGDWVAKDEVLAVLGARRSTADRDQLLNQIAGHQAAIARINGLMDSLSEPDFAAYRTVETTDEYRGRAETEQFEIFKQTQRSHSASIEILRARSTSAQATQMAKAAQIEAVRQTKVSIEAQLSETRELFERRLAKADDVRQLEQRLFSVESDLARLLNEELDAKALDQDLRAQLQKTRVDFSRELAEELNEVRVQFSDRIEALEAAEDTVSRQVVRAPQDGEIHNLAFSTVGGVVRPGEPILEIVPESETTVASVQIRPNDRASVNKGQVVRAQIVAFKGWQVPELMGEVVSLSADLKTDTVTGLSYYEARILIPKSEIKKLEGVEIRPGMPMQAFVFSGKQRTLLNYLIEPISGSLFRGTRHS